MSRTERTNTTTTVRHVAEPLASKGRENGPHLGDLRAFVAECEGLPDSIVVRINKGHMGESGRYDVTFETSWQRPASVAAEAATDGECCGSGRCEVCSPGYDWGRDG